MSGPSPIEEEPSGFLRRVTEKLELDCYSYYRLDEEGTPRLISSSCLSDSPELGRELLAYLREESDGGLELAEETELPAVLRESGVRSAALRPLRVRGALRGFLLFCSGQGHFFNQRVRGLLDLVSEELISEALTSGKEPFELANERIRNLILQLSEAEERERRRIADVFHGDLQQMVAGAKVHVDMAARRLGEEDAYLLERLQTAAALLNDVLERTRSVSQELSPALVRRRGLNAALESLASQMGRSYGLVVDVTVSGEIPPLDEAARMILYRAVQELLFNVAKHAGTNHAQIQIRGRGRSFQLTVKDDGKGFDVDLTLGDQRGSGLGLVTIRDRIDAIGGQLEIDSVPGGGSSFTISLETPRGATRSKERQRPPREVAASPPRSPGARSPSGVTSVLIVDDHAVIRQGLAVLIDEEEDLTVVGEAESGEEAIEAARRLTPEVVVMDFTMGGMDGAEATRRIKAELPDTRVIGLSMHLEDDTPQRMLDAGAEVYLPKEGPSEDVIAAIRQT